jgi:hypothetical protein
MMQSWLNIALLYFNMKQFGFARKYLDLSRGYFESRNDTSAMALWNQNYGKLENELGHHEQNQIFLHKAEIYHQKFNDSIK